MKKILTLVALISSISIVAAQDSATATLIGIQSVDGATTFVEPSTTIVVDLTIEKEQIIPGPYARYAQKLLGTRGNLVERTSYDVTAATISLADCKTLATNELAQDKVEIASHLGTIDEFAKILPNRLDNSIVSAEEAAEQTVQAIFNIRKHRMELITGEAGENIFGAGLKDALQALDATEQSYLELFYGKKITTVTHHRYIIPVEGDKTSYNIVKFSNVSGIEEGDSSDGSPVVLKITPSANTALKYSSEADARAKSTAEVRIANMAKCEVVYDDAAIATVTLPIYEFGKTVKVAK